MATSLKKEEDDSAKTQESSGYTFSQLQEYFSANNCCGSTTHYLPYFNPYVGMVPSPQVSLSPTSWPGIISSPQTFYASPSWAGMGCEPGVPYLFNTEYCCYRYPIQNVIQPTSEIPQESQNGDEIRKADFPENAIAPSLEIKSSFPENVAVPSQDIKSSLQENVTVPSPEIKSSFPSQTNVNLYTPGQQLGRPKLIPTTPVRDQKCIFDVFQQYMTMLFKQLPHTWYLNVKSQNLSAEQWFFFKDFCKVRFCCKECRTGWTSMNGMIAFNYRISNDQQYGEIVYTIPGQTCYSCNDQEFQDPLWYPDEAYKVIANLYYEVASKCYNLITPKLIRTRHFGVPKAKHMADLCQGCNLGICKYTQSKIQLTGCD